MSLRFLMLPLGSLCLSAAVQAAQVVPTHYDMPNGYGQSSGGSFNYWDAAYDGAGDRLVDFAPLSGGRGDLTDGVTAAESWWLVENVEGTGPYVGWRDIDVVIDFHFDGPQQFQSLTVWHDDADGFGNVATPSGFVVTVGATSQTFLIDDPAGASPLSTTLALGPGWSGSSLTLQVLYRDSGVMLSEVAFQAMPVPEPATWALWLAGAAAVGRVARRRRAPQRA